MKKKSIIDALQQVDAVQNNHDCAPHIVIGIDSCEHGHPHSGVLLTQGTPGILLGMIDTLMNDLKKTRKNIMREMTLYKTKNKEGDTLKERKPMSTSEEMQKKIENTKSEVEKIIKRLPPHIAEKIKKFQAKMDEAIERGDTEELERMRDAMQDADNIKDIENIIKDTPKDDEDFDLNAYKGD